jgi:hypothetical protein
MDPLRAFPAAERTNGSAQLSTIHRYSFAPLYTFRYN